MFDDFNAPFNAIFDSYSAFTILTISWGKKKLYVEGDIEADEVKTYLADHGIEADAWDLSNGVVIAIDPVDEARTRAVLEAWC